MKTFFLNLILIFLTLIHAKREEAGGTPQLGWNSWNKFGCDISEKLIKDIVDALSSTGLRDAGYEYVNIDDCWQATSRDNGKLVADPQRFPSGMKALGDYIHSKGFKFGIYSSAGFKTCQAFPASLGLEEVDAKTFSDWGVDYLKYDNCYQDHGLPQDRFRYMSAALQSVTEGKKNIFFSLCEWGRENPAVWASGIGGNSWRVTADIRDSWDSVVSRAEIDASLWRFAGPHLGWNDPDMLEIGNGGCSYDEYVSHFSLWSILKAPLIVGNDVTKLNHNDSTLAILTNKEVLAINQDPLGYQARRIWSDVMDLTSSFEKGRLIATKCTAVGEEEDKYGDELIMQKWELTEDNLIKSKATGLCLSEELERNVVTANCNEANKWTYGVTYIGGSIVSQNSGLCLEVSRMEVNPLFLGKKIRTSKCRSLNEKQYLDISEHQSWVLQPEGELVNLYQRQCLTVDQDAPSGLSYEIWGGKIIDNQMVVQVLNKSKEPQVVTLSLNMLAAITGKVSDGISYSLRDLWKHADLDVKLSTENDVKFNLSGHQSVLLTLKSSKDFT